jgi:hypothetical protein
VWGKSHDRGSFPRNLQQAWACLAVPGAAMLREGLGWHMLTSFLRGS